LTPAIAINQPTNGAAFAAGADVPFAVTATDTDGSVVKVEYFAGTNKIPAFISIRTCIFSVASNHRFHAMSGSAPPIG
jgi:hypothetical protein